MEKKLIDIRIIYCLLIILALPFIAMVFFSFVANSNGFIEINFQGFQELSKSVRLQEIRAICYRSLIVSFLSTIIAYLISYLLVIYTNKKFQIFFLILITLPFLANEAVRVFSWQNVLAENGLFNKFISSFYKNEVTIFSSASDINIYTTMVITCIPFAIFICTATLKIIPDIYWKVSNDLKLHQITKFIKIGLSANRFDSIFAFGVILLVFIILFYLAFFVFNKLKF
jgi:ABC-type spermidine/putrescine transport system permease subunit I